MNSGPRRRVVRLIAAVLAAIAMLVGGGYLLRVLEPSGESMGSMPEGLVSNPVWHGDYVYFLHEAVHIDAAKELWRIKPGGKAEPVTVANPTCPSGHYLALAERPGRDLALVMECNDSIQVVRMRTDTLDTEPIALVSGDPEEMPAVARIAWVGDRIMVSEDGYRCGGVGLIDGTSFMPVPTLLTRDGPLDLGIGLKRAVGECAELPVGGFVTPIAQSVAFLASRDAVGRAGDKRDDARWSIYRTTINWDIGELVVDGFEDPSQMVPLNGCGLLVAAQRGGSDGIWLVGPDGRTEQVLSGEFSDFAVQGDGEALAIVDGSGYALRLVRQPLKEKAVCRSNPRF